MGVDSTEQSAQEDDCNGRGMDCQPGEAMAGTACFGVTGLPNPAGVVGCLPATLSLDRRSTHRLVEQGGSTPHEQRNRARTTLALG